LVNTKDQALHRPHHKVGPLGVILIIFWFHFELFTNIHRALAFRLQKSKKKKNTPTLQASHNPVVVLLGDNLDEINGIALHTRTLVRFLSQQGKSIYLIGIAFHTQQARMESYGGGRIHLIRGRVSMEQPGYAASEISIGKMAPLLRLCKRYPVDLIEFQTPGSFSALAMILAKIAGIKTVSHYRTDMYAYVDMLIKWKPGKLFIKSWVRAFTWLTGPVIVPSQAMALKASQLGIPKSKITQLPRGVTLSMFNPEKGKKDTWKTLLGPTPGMRLLYVGRISKEKNLELLVSIVEELSKKIPFHLALVGEGPYQEELNTQLKPFGQYTLTGVLRGEDLAGIYASADLFLFPSLTDTFGNTVLEALASGTPCLVSPEGGPREIIEEGICGFICDVNKPQAMVQKCLELYQNPSLLKNMGQAARERSLFFTHEASAQGFWEYYIKTSS